MFMILLAATVAPSLAATTIKGEGKAPVLMVELSEIPTKDVVCIVEDTAGRSWRLEWTGKASDVRTRSVVVGSSSVSVSCLEGAKTPIEVSEGKPGTDLKGATVSAGARYRSKVGSPVKEDGPKGDRSGLTPIGLGNADLGLGLGGGARGFGIEDVGLELAEDTLKILAEYAQTRFNHGIYELVGEKIELMVCEDLSLQDLKSIKDDGSTKASSLAKAMGLKGSLLPETCATLRDVVLTDLVNDPEPLVNALVEDLFNLGFRSVAALNKELVKDQEAADTLDQVVAAVQDAVRAVVLDGAPSTELGPRLLTALGKVEWKGVKTGTHALAWNTGACAADLALVATSVCRDTGACSSEELAVLVDVDLDGKTLSFAAYEPSDTSACGVLQTTASSDSPPGLSKAVRTLERLTTSLSSDLLAVALAVDSKSTEDDAPATIRLGFDLLIALVDLKRTDKAEAGMEALVASSLGHLRDLTLALVADEPRTVVLEGAAMMSEALEFVLADGDVETDLTKSARARRERRKLLQAAQRITPVVSTLSHNALALSEASEVAKDPDLDEETRTARLEALAEARKTAVEDLVIASTKRSDRGGDSVFSLGANPGFYMSAAPGTMELADLPFSMPMGFAVTGVPAPGGTRNSGGRDRGQWAWGYQLQVSALDLTYFLPGALGDDGTDKVKWTDAFMGGIQVGPTVGRPSGNLGLMADLRYRPYAADDEERWMAGVGLTWFVPFFDMN